MTGRIRGVLTVCLTLSTLAFLGACGSGSGPGLSREQYVDLYVDILRARDAAPDSIAALDSARAVLERHGVTEDDLQGFSDSYVDNPGALSLIWLEIENRLRFPAGEDSTEARSRSEEEEEEE